MWIKEYTIKHSASFNYEFGGDDLSLDDSNDTKDESKEYKTKANDDDYDYKTTKKDNYVVDLKQYMTTQECKELEKRWLNNKPVMFKLSSNRNVQTMVVNDNDDYKNGTGNYENKITSEYVFNDTYNVLCKIDMRLLNSIFCKRLIHKNIKHVAPHTIPSSNCRRLS